jgi:hypothetical protein
MCRRAYNAERVTILVLAVALVLMIVPLAKTF